MGANAEERLLKRKINELEQDLKRLKRELDEAKSLKKQVCRLRKQNKRAVQQQLELEDVLEQEDTSQEATNESNAEINQSKPLRCKKKECSSDQVKTIAAGVRTIVICEKCGAKYSFKN